MKAIKVERLYVEGMRTVHQQEFKFNSEGVNVITGRNGHGKTTLPEAVLFGFFGENLKKSNVDNLITYKHQRPKDYRGLLVLIEFKVNEEPFILYRTRDFKGTLKGLFPNGEEVEINGDELELYEVDSDTYLTAKSQRKAESQDIINSVLGITSRMFLNTVLFGQRMARLSEQTSGTIYDILSDMFDLSFIDEASARAKMQAEEERTGLVKEETRIEALETNIEQELSGCEHKESTLQKHKDELDRLLKEQVTPEFTEEQLSKAMEAKKDYDEFMAKYNEWSDHYMRDKERRDEVNNKLRKVKNNHQSTLTEYRTKLEKVETGVCPECGQPVPPGSSDLVELKRLARKIKQLKAMYVDLKEKLGEPDGGWDEWEAARKKWNDYIKPHEKILKEHEQVKEINSESSEKIAVSKDRIERIEENLLASRERVESLQAELAAKKEGIDELKRRVEDYEFWAKSGFGTKGLKGYMFNAYMEELNNACLAYGKLFGLKVRFKVDLTKKSKSIDINVSQKDSQVMYNDLSGGEKARVDICIAFAMHEVLKSKAVNFNILFMDELFEGLDKQGTDTVLSIAREKANEVGVYIITHLLDSVADAATTVVQAIKEDNSTRYEVI